MKKGFLPLLIWIAGIASCKKQDTSTPPHRRRLRPAFFLMKAGYFGKLPTHLILSMRKDPYLAIDFQYAKDNKGRVISIVGQYAFKYQCP